MEVSYLIFFSYEPQFVEGQLSLVNLIPPFLHLSLLFVASYITSRVYTGTWD